MSENSLNTSGIISLKDIVNAIKDYTIEYLKSWKLIILFSIPILFLFYRNYSKDQTKYFAENKFLVEGSGAGGGGLSAILNQIGARGQGAKFNPWKITETATAKKTIKEILFQKYDNDYIANHIIKLYKLQKKWSKTNPELSNFLFKDGDFSKFRKAENEILTRIINLVTGGKTGTNALMIFKYNEESAVYSYSFKTVDEQLSYELANRNFLWLKNFFENEMIANQLGTSKILKDKADSIKMLINSKTYQAAQLSDQSMGLVRSAPNSKKVTLEREIGALSLAYAELIKSFENADVTIKDIKPMFLLLDEPLLPLENDEPSLITTLIKAFLFIFLITFLITILRKSIKDALAQ